MAIVVDIQVCSSSDCVTHIIAHLSVVDANFWSRKPQNIFTLFCHFNDAVDYRQTWMESSGRINIKSRLGCLPQGPHERLLPLRNWTEKRFIFSNTGVHSGDKSGNRIFRNVWPFEKLRVENWQICLHPTWEINDILFKFKAMFPTLCDYSRPWRLILAWNKIVDTPF